MEMHGKKKPKVNRSPNGLDRVTQKERFVGVFFLDAIRSQQVCVCRTLRLCLLSRTAKPLYHNKQ